MKRSKINRLFQRNVRLYFRLNRSIKQSKLVQTEGFIKAQYEQVVLVMRFVFGLLVLALIPFAATDVRGYLVHGGLQFVMFDIVFFSLGTLFFVGANFLNFNRMPFWKMKVFAVSGVLFASLSATSVAILTLQSNNDLSLFTAGLLSASIMFRFPDNMRFVIYGVNITIFYAAVWLSGVWSNLHLQNSLFTIILLVIFDRVAYMSAANSYLRRLRIAELNRKLLEEDKRKSELIRISVHDLKSPLAGIASITDLILGSSQSITESKKTEALEQVRRSSLNLLGVVEDIINTTTVAIGNLPLTINKFDCGSLLAKIIQNMSVYYTAKGIEIKFTEQALYLNSDVRLVTKIFENVLSNAIKYSPAKSEIAVSLLATKEGIEFICQDAGPGFGSGSDSGNGIGLQIGASFLERLKGHLSVINRSVGAEVKVSVPNYPERETDVLPTN